MPSSTGGCPTPGGQVGNYQLLWRLAGVDHMHVHGLDGKFAQPDDEVIDGARDCLSPLGDGDDRVLPAFSSGQ